MKEINVEVSCPICGACSAPFNHIDGYEHYKCIVCGHGFIYPLPSLDYLKAIYNNDQSHVSNGAAFQLLEAYMKDPENIHYYNKGLIKIIQDVVGIRNFEARVLEIGCSCGVLLKCLKDVGYLNVIGLDVNPQAVEKGRRSLGLALEVGSIEDVSVAEKYDVIIAFAVLEHVADPNGFIQTVKKHLTANGVAIFIVPNFNGYLRFVMGKRWLWYMPPFHLHHFTVKSITKLSENHGVSLEKIFTTNIATYLYFVYYSLFGHPSDDNHTMAEGSYKLVTMIDKAIRILLFPFIKTAEMLNREAHIVFVIREQKN